MTAEHAKWIIESGSLELVAICEKNKERNIEIKGKYGIPVFNEINEFLKEDLDIAVVTTTNEVHEPIIVQALESGRNVM